MSRRKYIIGNWKMNGLEDSLVEARAIATHAMQSPHVDVALCPPASLLAAMHRTVPTLALGGQDCHQAAMGAYTGCISAAMLADAGAEFTLVGHSERREYFGEDSDLVAEKIAAAQEAGLQVILCVGEPQSVREAGDAVPYVLAQLAAIEAIASKESNDYIEGATIAYEPIWAIGSGLTAEVEQISAMHAAIREALAARYNAQTAEKMRILYGGSVSAENAAAILAGRDVDGALVGGASLSADKFLPIIDAT